MDQENFDPAISSMIEQNEEAIAMQLVRTYQGANSAAVNAVNEHKESEAKNRSSLKKLLEKNGVRPGELTEAMSGKKKASEPVKEIQENTTKTVPTVRDFREKQETLDTKDYRSLLENRSTSVGVPKRELPSKPTEVNQEHEPKNISWKPISVMDLQIMYPQDLNISNLWMSLASCYQQPGLSVGLLDSLGTKYLIKFQGEQLYIAEPTKNIQAFANVGLNPDYDDDDVDDRNVKTAGSPDPSRTFNSCNSGKVGPKLEHRTITVSSLNKLLNQVQARLDEEDSEELEELADQISDVIAEALIENKNKVSSKYSTLFEAFKGY